MNEFTFLTDDQFYESTIGNKDYLKVLKQYDYIGEVTDYAKLLGCNDNWWWTSTIDNSKNTEILDMDGYKSTANMKSRSVGARPATFDLDLFDISQHSSSEISEVLYGEYPQTVTPTTLSKHLEKLYILGAITSTNKSYTSDSVYTLNYSNLFKPEEHDEFIYRNKKYIRFVSTENNCDESLSHGRIIRYNRVYWVCVEPIHWLVDHKGKFAISKDILFSGLMFSRTECNSFADSDIYTYLNGTFKNEAFSHEHTDNSAKIKLLK